MGPDRTRVEGLLHKTLPKAKVGSVLRIQNKLLWSRHIAERGAMAMLNGGAPPKELELWHGTRGNNPNLVYNGQEGFDMRFCTSGMWGIASYFAVNASYSDNYAHPSPKGKQIMLASVMVGDAHECASNGSLKMPP